MGQKLYMIRHGEIDSRFNGRYVGKTDIPLSPQGRAAAKELGKKLKDLLGTGVRPSVFCGPSRRCQETWREIGGTWDLPVIFLEELWEVNFGEWEGKNFKEIFHAYPEEVRRWGEFDADFCFPGGESLGQFEGRMQGLKGRILGLAQTSRKKEQSNQVILVTHGGVITTLVCLFLGLQPSQHLLFRVVRPSLTTMEIFNNGLGVLTGLSGPDKGRGGEWPG